MTRLDIENKNPSVPSGRCNREKNMDASLTDYFSRIDSPERDSPVGVQMQALMALIPMEPEQARRIVNSADYHGAKAYAKQILIPSVVIKRII